MSLFLFYAHANSSEWGLIGHFARSAFRRTPSGRLTDSALATPLSSYHSFAFIGTLMKHNI